MIVSRTPLRISLAGGGTDFPEFFEKEELGGCVVSATINKYMYVAVNRRFDKRIRVGYSKIELVDSVDDIEHDLVRECMKLAGVEEGVEIFTIADVPSEGSGLGSSSALTVGLLNALYTYTGNSIWMDTLSRAAIHVEIAKLGNTIGVQDQIIAAKGGFRSMHFLPVDRLETSCIDLTPEKVSQVSDSLLLFHTGISRRATDILTEQQWNIEKNRPLLRQLRDQAIDLRDNLNFGMLGQLLHEGWQIKKQLASRISNPEIDEMYQKALDAGALGGKITGAGGGGFLLVFCPSKQEQVRRALRNYVELPFSIINEHSRILLNGR